MKNIWGNVPEVVEMQSEGGAAGAVHGALQAGALATTFTASQGLLLMIPNMYKIAGELTSYCMHVAARTVATHALSIFGDHSDVMACRQTGFAMLSSNSVQEAHDFAAIGQMATLKSRVPFLHFFDGFRTSHEVSKIEELADEDLRALLDPEAIAAHKGRALSPDRPVLRGSAQNPDAFFQAREACNRWYAACAGIVQQEMDRFAKRTGRAYRLFDYVGHPEAERVVVLMGSGAEAAHEAVEWMVARGEKVGIVKVRLYRPFDIPAFLAALPKSVKSIAVLDRTKEPGAIGDPLYMDVVTGLVEAKSAGLTRFAKDPVVVGGRYGLSSKEFTPAMVKAVFDELGKSAPKNHFTVGIVDDVTHTSLPWDPDVDTEADEVSRAVFYGLGADGTVSANKNSIKIIGEETGKEAQGYFVYDSKKSGAVTISHLRFSAKPIRSTYLITKAKLRRLPPGVVPRQVRRPRVRGAGGHRPSERRVREKEEVWDALPREVQETIVERKLRVFGIDAYKVARELGMGARINTIMQTCFFAISGVLPREDAIAEIKKAIEKTYGRKGAEIVKKNFAAVDGTLEHLFELPVPRRPTATRRRPPIVSDAAPDFVQARHRGHAGRARATSFRSAPSLPTGRGPLATARWEKRNIALDIPVWDEKICIQCNKCAMVCPHAAIRVKVYDPARLGKAPATFKSIDFKGPEFKGQKYTVQVAPEDCTGCGLCVDGLPGQGQVEPEAQGDRHAPAAPAPRGRGARTTTSSSTSPRRRATRSAMDVKGTQFLEPLFEFSGACAGCGETPYVKLLTQLFGDRTLIANATGCSSIYGGNLPTTPYATNRDGRGPAWSNSLFEDNAEFGFGYPPRGRLAERTTRRTS